MLKKIIPLLLALSIAFLPSCGDSGMTKVANISTTEILGLTMRTERDTYTANDEIKIVIESSADSNISFGNDVLIDLLKDGEWYRLASNSNVVPRDLQVIASGDKRKITISPDNYKVGKWPKGQYRIVKSFELLSSDGVNSVNGGNVICKFEVA